jgi:hypothetical protein
MKLTPYLHPARILKMCGAILLFPIVCLYDVDRDNFIFTFIVHKCALAEDNIAVYQGAVVQKVFL